jgi:hypothetical protein
VAAGNAKEHRLRLSVGTVDRFAARALLARVAWVDCKKWNAAHLGLVGHKGPKLSEAPRMQTAALAFLGPNARADVGQIFDHYPQSLAFSPRNKFLGYAMVDVFSKVSLSLGKFLQSPLGGLGPASLQSGFALGYFGPKRFDGGTGVAVPLAVERDVYHTEVNAENTLDVDRCGVRYVANARDVPLALDQHQIDFALSERQQLALPVAADERDLFAETALSPLKLKILSSNGWAARLRNVIACGGRPLALCVT